MKEFKSSYQDRHNREWNFKITNKVALDFCGEFNLMYEQLLPTTLNDMQLFQMAWSCLQKMQTVRVNFHEKCPDHSTPFEEWLESACEGEDLAKCKEAVQNALVNFTLGRSTEKNRIILHKLYTEARAAEEEVQDGASEKLSNSASEQESSPDVITPSVS